ncbi:membrane protein [Sphingomonas melonis]|uniref:Membrane protein n=1 Tax=Sphingomonas melonis TaxID=152682 RepID=A0A0D1KPF6_9SPHN|nr:membrane protein [Sphingomonas melonis]KIU26364.1 membrane protein [Sphingomonas melonis]
MATAIGRGGTQVKPWAADAYEKALSVGALLLLAAVLTAILRGHAHWAMVPGIVWAHILTILVALGLTPVILLSPRGDRRHRILGRIWAAAMLLTALLSFGIREANGGFSFIHILSAWVVIQVPLLWYAAHAHKVALHRGSVRGMVTGALLIAGFFTFPFGRLLGRWLFG